MGSGLDFFLRIWEEARQGLGEDAWCHCRGRGAELLAVFDGCGGSGARKHAVFSGHSEAYVASRLCAGAFYDAFGQYCSVNEGPVEPHDVFELCASYSEIALKACRPPKDPGKRLVSSMISTLPTTVSAAIVRHGEDRIEVTAAWAGDSRVYVLTPEGLAQMTADDSDEADPFETDGMMTNTLSADKTLNIHEKRCVLPTPALVLSATDGCFAYYTTPMEFEGVLLRTLLAAESPDQWEQALREQFRAVAGDDFTLVLASFGFGSFPALQAAFRDRLARLQRTYLDALEKLPPDDLPSRRAMWSDYRSGYMRLLEER